MGNNGWWGARLYLVPPENDGGLYPDMSIQFSGLRRELADVALPAMVQALADAVGVPVRIRVPNDADHPADNLTISPATVQ